jgi:D-xylose transport system ATP-binding protein
MNETAPILATRAIIKRFPGVVALKGVSFDLRPGEIHALCGENGAGKSTLIKVLSGIHPHGSYEGDVAVDGRPAAMVGPRDAEKAGIAVIYQELALVPEMSVAENLFLGAEPKRLGLIDWDKVFVDARQLLARFNLDIDPAAKVSELGVGRQQLVEIAKAIGKRSRILILDEPTAALTEQEVAILLDILRDLRRQGIACVYISHKLDEVFAIADRITVLRDGQSIVTLDTSKTAPGEVIRHMVGREINELFPRQVATPGEVLLSVDRLTVSVAPKSEPVLEDISFDVRAGEVLGIGGLMGSGRTELLTHLFGAWGHRVSGTVELGLNGRAMKLDVRSPHEALSRGLALVSEDRKRYGLVLPQGIGFNLSLSTIERMQRAGFIDRNREFTRNKTFFDAMRIKAPDQETVVGTLSGGNQQKVVLGKALMTEPRVIFLDEPTRGIDVGAKIEVYELINQLTAQGKAVVLVSSELPELMGMSDRIVMLHEGRVGGTFTRAEATQERLLSAAMGRETITA